MNRLITNKCSSFIDGFWEGLSSPIAAFASGNVRRVHICQLKSRRNPRTDEVNIRQDFLRAFDRYGEETAKATRSEKK